ncbi:MAG TPA: hypothetical protein PK993_00310 [Clostridia bacterium]|nr:hypothetical protein [Clostridia bacterium]
MRKNNEISIIIITGHSGAGKTTVSNTIAKILDCPAIHGDEIMFDFVGLFPEETYAKFGDKPKKDGQKWFSHYFRDNTTIKNEQSLVKLTKKYVDKQFSELLKALNCFDIFNNNNNRFISNQKAVYNPKIKPAFVVFEWHAAPQISHWNNAIARILVKANMSKRKSMLMERMSNEGITKEDVPDIRYMAIEPQFKKVEKQIDFIVKNEYNTDLEKRLYDICTSIKNKKN